METVGDKATLSYSTAGPTGPFTPLAGIIDVTPNKISVKQVDTNKLDSAADESQAGTPDYGEVSVTLAYGAATTTLVNGWVANKTTLDFKLSVDDATGTGTDSAEPFKAWVKEWEPMAGELKKDERAKSKLVLKITGAATFNAATGA